MVDIGNIKPLQPLWPVRQRDGYRRVKQRDGEDEAKQHRSSRDESGPRRDDGNRIDDYA